MPFFNQGSLLMKRTAMMMVVAMLVTAGVASAQETVSPAPASPVEGGKVIKAKAKPMTAVGMVKSITADSLVISDATGKDWTFGIDASTKVAAPKETVDAGTVSPVEGGKQMPGKPATGQETVDVAPVSPVEGGKVIKPKPMVITDVKEGQHVRVTYHEVDGKNHATQVRVQ
jgi:hypothetical protein